MGDRNAKAAAQNQKTVSADFTRRQIMLSKFADHQGAQGLKFIQGKKKKRCDL